MNTARRKHRIDKKRKQNLCLKTWRTQM